ncbi:MAG: thymidine phosphorylase [Candidatus Eiseniibacteriota bacterium]
MKDLIRRKRDGGALTDQDIDRWVRGVADGSIPDYQSAALLMAITLRGMSHDETLALTRAMLASGRTLEWTKLGRPTVDKHSTGGVGDKVSLALAPWIAACGACVPMIAGRGLGHTGGTLDKLEAIPGYRVELTLEEFSAQLASVGLVIAGQSDELVPADRELYALRDVTATVESVPLIVASIVSKKFASGAAGVVFDVKCGRGAFMRGREEAATLARELLRTSRALGRKARALLTDMEQPLGAEVGNACETEEAFSILRGEGPEDLKSICRELGAAMLVLAGVAREKHEAEARLDRALDSGEAVRRAETWIEAQGGDPGVVTDSSKLPKAAVETAVISSRSGYVTRIDAHAIGDLLVVMGGGRAQKEDLVDPAVGVRLLRKAGAKVDAGEPVAIVRAHEEAKEWAEAAGHAFSYGDAPPPARPLVLEEL